MKFFRRIIKNLNSRVKKEPSSKLNDGYLKKYVIGDNVVLMDQMTEDFMTSKLPDPKNDDLNLLFKSANYIEISEKKFGEGEDIVRIKCSSQDDLKELNNLLLIDEENSDGHWMSVGEFEFVFKHNSEELARIELLGAGSLRWYNKWKGDAILIHSEMLLYWLDKFGLSEPLKRAVEDEERLKRDIEFHDHWLSFAPKTIVDYMEQKGTGECVYDTSEIKDLLEKEIPDIHELIRKLLGLYGTSENFWSGYPIYEEIPKDLIDNYEISDILEAIKGSFMLSEIKCGLVRYLGSKRTFNSRKTDYKSIPKEIKSIILEVMDETGNKNSIIKKELE